MTNLSLVQTLTENICKNHNVNPNNLDECLQLAKEINGIKDDDKINISNLTPEIKELLNSISKPYNAFISGSTDAQIDVKVLKQLQAIDLHQIVNKITVIPKPNFKVVENNISNINRVIIKWDKPIALQGKFLGNEEYDALVIAYPDMAGNKRIVLQHEDNTKEYIDPYKPDEIEVVSTDIIYLEMIAYKGTSINTTVSLEGTRGYLGTLTKNNAKLLRLSYKPDINNKTTKLICKSDTGDGINYFEWAVAVK